MKIEQVLELYEPLRISGDESAERIQSAFRKLHANLQFRSQCAVVSISGGSDSDVMLDMIQVLEPEKTTLMQISIMCGLIPDWNTP